MDRVSPETRSRIMSLVKSKDTKPELMVFRELRRRKIYFQKHYRVSGKPDVAFPRLKIAVFINGEFWHGRNLDKYRGTLSDKWITKIETNAARDRKNYRLLKKAGWKVIVLWDINIYKRFDAEIRKIERAIVAAKS